MSAAEPPPETTVHAIRGWRWWLVQPLGWLLRLWGASLRFESSVTDLRNYTYAQEPVAMVIWHNRLFVASEIFRRFRSPRPLFALVSASKDGAALEALFALVRLRTVRGSSSRLGREAASALINVLRAGHDVGITPDGPRGPRYVFKPGTLIITRRTRTPLLLTGVVYEHAWTLRSWDRFQLPAPFSRVRMRCEFVAAESAGDRNTQTAALETRMLTLNPDNAGASRQAAVIV